eukprot:760347_1
MTPRRILNYPIYDQHCRYFNRGMCRRGAQCHYIHAANCSSNNYWLHEHQKILECQAKDIQDLKQAISLMTEMISHGKTSKLTSSVHIPRKPRSTRSKRKSPRYQSQSQCSSDDDDVPSPVAVTERHLESSIMSRTGTVYATPLSHNVQQSTQRIQPLNEVQRKRKMTQKNHRKKKNKHMKSDGLRADILSGNDTTCTEYPTSDETSHSEQYDESESMRIPLVLPSKKEMKPPKYSPPRHPKHPKNTKCKDKHCIAPKTKQKDVFLGGLRGAFANNRKQQNRKKKKKKKKDELFNKSSDINPNSSRIPPDKVKQMDYGDPKDIHCGYEMDIKQLINSDTDEHLVLIIKEYTVWCTAQRITNQQRHPFQFIKYVIELTKKHPSSDSQFHRKYGDVYSHFEHKYPEQNHDIAHVEPISLDTTMSILINEVFRYMDKCKVSYDDKILFPQI